MGIIKVFCISTAAIPGSTFEWKIMNQFVCCTSFLYQTFNAKVWSIRLGQNMNGFVFHSLKELTLRLQNLKNNLLDLFEIRYLVYGKNTSFKSFNSFIVIVIVKE